MWAQGIRCSSGILLVSLKNHFRLLTGLLVLYMATTYSLPQVFQVDLVFCNIKLFFDLSALLLLRVIIGLNRLLACLGFIFRMLKQDQKELWGGERKWGFSFTWASTSGGSFLYSGTFSISGSGLFYRPLVSLWICGGFWKPLKHLLSLLKHNFIEFCLI